MSDKTLLARFGRTPETARAALARELGVFAAQPERLGTVWLEPYAPGKWSPAEITEHVMKVNVSIGKVLRLLRSDRPLPEQTQTPGQLANGKAQSPEFALPGAPQPWEGLQPAWLEAGARLLAESQETEVWHGRTFFHPYFGNLGALGWVQAASLHTAHHRRQLETL